jgi:serine/threonine-protein kinase
MIVSHCLNPYCTRPQNQPKEKICQTCGFSLILHNRYRGVKKIGKGGFGATFLALDLSLPGSPLCVIKQLRASAEDPNSFRLALELFEREAKTLGKIDHPQIPKLLDYFEENQQFYLVQSLVKGRNLRQEVKKNGVFNERAAKRFLAEMLPVMKYIHSIKIIHRDIKPANIIRREIDGQLTLIDFGAVKDQVSSQLLKTYGKTALTQFSIGTVGFAPPEQLAMRPVYSSDLYALGATCLFLMTGKSPKNFPIDEITGKLVWEEEINISPNFAQVLGKMLEVDLHNRFKMADEVIRALDLVPYQQELQQSLINQKSLPPQAVFQQMEVEITEGNYADATIKLAKAIRARKSRQGKTKFVLNLTPQTLLRAYANGRKNFSDESLNQFNLANFDLSGANFSNCQLERVNLEQANLANVNFYKSNLSSAILCKANLQETYLRKANLVNADLKGADLRKADLTNANLKGANLCGANLTDAKVEEVSLKQTKTNWSTIFPDGKRKIWD